VEGVLEVTWDFSTACQIVAVMNPRAD